MRHKKSLRKFGRQSDQRKAMFRSLCTSLVQYEKIETTLPKAKDLRRQIEKAITIAKKYRSLDNDTPESKGQKYAKRNQLNAYFHGCADKELLGRNAIKKYVTNLNEEDREAVLKYMDNPEKNPKPDFVLDYIPATATRTVTVKGEEKTISRKDSQRILRVEGTITKLINKIAPRFENRPGGYTRIYKLGNRRGDNAEMAIIEFVE